MRVKVGVGGRSGLSRREHQIPGPGAAPGVRPAGWGVVSQRLRHPACLCIFFREPGLRGQLRSRVKTALDTEDGWKRGRWCPAGDPAPLNRELRDAPGTSQAETGLGTRQRTRAGSHFQMASQRAPRSRCPGVDGGEGGDIWGGRSASRPEEFPPPSPWPGSLYLRSRDGFTGGSHHPGSD
uniref:Uncharacterized protein n=1 Tax=Rangifer tarandus platyrhynchus TaxID=3082113 RepID=A0ACB0E621_RANTA|nr:unnamed protein product [Rangifer tarandus platyrhynchus]